MRMRMRVRAAPTRHCGLQQQRNRRLRRQREGPCHRLIAGTRAVRTGGKPISLRLHRVPCRPFYSALGDNPSINSLGFIAFIGTNASTTFENPWVVSFTTFTQLGTTAEEVYGRPAQINNASQTVIRDRRSGAPPPTRIRIFDLATPTTGTNVAIGGSPPIDTVFSHPSINNLGEAVYTGLTSGVRFMSNGVDSVTIAAPSPRPMIADTGQVILNDNGTIKLYSSTRSAPAATIASAAVGFTALGNAAGISDSGKVVAFSGDKGERNRRICGDRYRQRLSASPRSRWRWGPAREPNADRYTRPRLRRRLARSLSFSSIDLSNRVGVAHWEGGPPGASSAIRSSSRSSVRRAGKACRGCAKKFVPGIFFYQSARIVHAARGHPQRHRRWCRPTAHRSARRAGRRRLHPWRAVHRAIHRAARSDIGGRGSTRRVYPWRDCSGSHYLTFWASDGSEHAIFRAAHLNPRVLPRRAIGAGRIAMGQRRLWWSSSTGNRGDRVCVVGDYRSRKPDRCPVRDQ